MSKGNIGVGSASIILVFAVLALAIFSLISLTAATNEKALVDAEAMMVVGYYEADALATLVLSFLMEHTYGDAIPKDILGVSITSEEGVDGGFLISYSCYVSPLNELYVEVLLDDFILIREWSLYDTTQWQPDHSQGVWIPP